MPDVARVYLAGPRSGIPKWNTPAFEDAAADLRARDLDVVTPLELQGTNEGMMGEVEELPEHVYVRGLEACIAGLTGAAVDAVVVLDGWEASRGANLEVDVARRLGKPILSYPSLTPIRSRTLPTGSAQRKAVPLTTGVLDYFPAALAAVAEVSKAGNDQHNPGEPLHHARAKSADHPDCLLRHFMDRGLLDTDGLRHSAKVAWRALALLQEELEAAGAPLARGAKV